MIIYDGANLRRLNLLFLTITFYERANVANPIFQITIITTKPGKKIVGNSQYAAVPFAPAITEQHKKYWWKIKYDHKKKKPATDHFKTSHARDGIAQNSYEWLPYDQYCWHGVESSFRNVQLGED